MPDDGHAQERLAFAALFEAHFDALLAYARRRTNHLSDAEDVVADSFMVVWRRLADLPHDESERLPWLYGIARRVLANQRRGAARRVRLRDRLAATARRSASGGSSRLASAVEALARLRQDDQEILRLVAWEELTYAEVGVALGVTPNAAAIRVHRARRRLVTAMKGSGHVRTWLGWKGSVKQPAGREDLP